MKQSISGGGGGGGVGGYCGLRIPKENEVEVLEILLSLPKLFAKSELLGRYTFTWGRKKKRSVLVSKSESSPSTHRQIDESRPEKATAAEADDNSPSTPLCFLPSGSGSDGGDKPKEQSSLKKNSKKRTAEDLMEKYNGMQQQREILVRKIKAMEILHQELRAQNLELKAKRQEMNYSRNMEDFQLWNTSVKLNLDQQHYHQQMSMFAPQQQQQQQHCQQLMVDPNNGKLVAVSCSSNNNTGGRLGLFNQIDPRVNNIHGEAFDFLASSQPLDQNQYMVMDNDARVRTAAAARKRRIMRMKENRNSTLAMKLSRVCR